MKILGVNTYQPNFKAHSYKIEPRDKSIYIQTDNNPYRGEQPYLVWYNDDGDKIEQEMIKEGNLYSG